MTDWADDRANAILNESWLTERPHAHAVVARHLRELAAGIKAVMGAPLMMMEPNGTLHPLPNNDFAGYICECRNCGVQYITKVDKGCCPGCTAGRVVKL